MGTFIKKYFFAIFIVFVATGAWGQATNTTYYMENSPFKNYLNPSFQPIQNFYLSLPVIGYLHSTIQNNSLSVKNILQKDSAGNTITFLHPQGDLNGFYNSLQPTTMVVTDTKINLLGAGLRFNDDYFTLDISQRLSSQVLAPKDIFKLALFGTPDFTTNQYKLSTLALNVDEFTDISLGYAHKASKRLYWGAKMRLLLGNNNKSLYNSQMKLNANIDQWNLKGSNTINSAGGDKLQVIGRFNEVRYTSVNSIKDFFTIAGVGAGVDVGVYYRLKKQLTVSASLTDLGFIRWGKNATNTKTTVDYSFAGVNKDINDGYSFDALLDSVKQAFNNATEIQNTEKSYNSYLMPKLNLGAEYSFFENRLSVGLLSRTMMKDFVFNEEITTSLNARPWDWANASVSYSLINGRFSTYGLGLGIQTGPIYWYGSADYLGFYNVPIPLQKINSAYPNVKFGVAENSQAFNIGMGIIITLEELNFDHTQSPNSYKKGKKLFDAKPCRCSDDEL